VRGEGGGGGGGGGGKEGGGGGGGGGGGKTKKIMQGRVTEKKIVQRRNSCRVNCTVGLTNSTRLTGTLAATLYFRFNFLDLVFSTIRKTYIFQAFQV